MFKLSSLTQIFRTPEIALPDKQDAITAWKTATEQVIQNCNAVVPENNLKKIFDDELQFLERNEISLKDFVAGRKAFINDLDNELLFIAAELFDKYEEQFERENECGIDSLDAVDIAVKVEEDLLKILEPAKGKVDVLHPSTNGRLNPRDLSYEVGDVYQCPLDALFGGNPYKDDKK